MKWRTWSNMMTANHIGYMAAACATCGEHGRNRNLIHYYADALLPFIGDHVIDTLPTHDRPTFVQDMLMVYSKRLISPKNCVKVCLRNMAMQASMCTQTSSLSGNVSAEWAALMHRYGVSYGRCGCGRFKIGADKRSVSRLAPSPYVCDEIDKEKNRQSYRQAVKLFKKMKAGSKKSGKTDFWNRYIDTVREKNRRLRALMEEMEKGNLNL